MLCKRVAYPPSKYLLTLNQRRNRNGSSLVGSPNKLSIVGTDNSLDSLAASSVPSLSTDGEQLNQLLSV